MRRRISTATRSTFRSMTIRNFRVFFSGQIISQIGTWLTTIALTLLVLHRTKSGLAIGALVACQFGPVLLLGAWGGLIADRSDKRRLLIITQILEMLQSFALAALAFMHHPPLGAFYVIALAGGFMLAFDNPARRSFVPEMVPTDYVQNAVTLNTAVMTSSRIFGPALAGVLVVTVGYAWCFAIDGLSYIAVIIGLFMIRPAELTRGVRATKAKGQVRAGLRYMHTVPEMWIPLVMTAVIGALTFNFPVVLPLFTEHTLKGSDGSYTVLYSILSVGSFTGALAAAQRRTITVGHTVRAAFAFGVAMLVFASAPTLLTVFPLALVVGFCSVSFLTAATAIVQVQADPAMRGRVMALQAMVMIGTTPIGGPLLGFVCDRYGARFGIVLGGVAAIAAAIWGRYASRRVTASRDDHATEIRSGTPAGAPTLG